MNSHPQLSLLQHGSLIDGDRYTAVGMAASIAADLSQTKPLLASTLVEEIVPAYRHGNLAFLYEAGRIAVGFITWARLSPLTEDRLLSTLDPWLHISEWNEGESLWVREFWLPQHYLKPGIGLLLNGPGASVQSVRRLVVRKGRAEVLEFCRRGLTRMASRA